MMFKRLRIALLVCSLVAAVSLTVRADDKAPDKKPEPLPAPAPAPGPANGHGVADGCGAPCAPAYKTVCFTEWVPEQYTATATVTNKNAFPHKYTCYPPDCGP